MIHSIRKVFAPRALIITDWSGPKEVNADKRWLRPVLGCLVHMAMQDGMTKLGLGIARDTQKSWMKFFGPRWYRRPIWWDMVPPEAYCYPTMLQICLSFAELDPSLPIKGVIEARKGRKPLNLQLEVREINSFEIAWDPKYALDRDEAVSNMANEEE